MECLHAQPLEVTNAPPVTPQNLITNVFLGEGVQVLDVQYQGANKSVGFFKNGDDEVGIGRGIVMTTGAAVSNAPETGVNSPGNAFASVNSMSNANDPDLQSIAGGATIFNVTKYIITFIPISDTLRFRYAFASEEYPEFACTQYNDIFGFFISGPGITGPYQNNAKNIALIPGTNLPVRINNVNPGVPGSAGGTVANCTPPNGSLNYSQYYNDNNGSANLPVYDGLTDVFTAEAVVIPCNVYTIKLVICDVGDSAYDSGVFLEAKSFGTGSLKVEATTVSLDGSVAEGCSPGYLTFSLPSPTESDFPIDYNIFGTATNGVDYQLIPDDLFIPAGDSIITVPIIALEDGLVEGTETLILDVQRDVCNRDTFYIYIKDNPLVPPDLGMDQSICTGTEIQLDGTLNVPVPEPPCFTNNTDLPLPLTNVPYFSDIQVGGVLPPILGPGVIRSVCIDSLDHRWIDDIDAYLISPDGQFLELTTDNGGNGGNGLATDYYLHTCFTLDAAMPINFPGPFAPPSAVPFTGEFQPEGVWSDLWDGNNKHTNGTWRLQLIDDQNGLDGTLHSWTICFNPAYEINYQWTPEVGLSCADCPNPTAMPTQNTTYVLTATDSYGCMVTDSIAIEAIPVLSAPNVSCGSATQTSVGIFWDDQPGAMGYEVNVDNGGWMAPTGATDHAVNGLVTSQSVTFSVRALADCPGEVTTLTCQTLACTPASITSTTTDVSCNAGADGSVTISASGTMGPYVYDLEGQSNDTGIFTGLSAGNHIATVTDGLGCPGPYQFTIDEPAALNVAPASTDVSCNGGADGVAAFEVSDGTGPYSFAWSSATSDSVATNLSAGVYTVTITDANGCPSIQSIEIMEPEALSLATAPQDVSCFGLADGEALATATGGTSPYSYQWDAAAGNQMTDQATGLPAGTYQVNVTDANGCQATQMTVIAENPPLQLQTSSTDATCDGASDGTVSVVAMGGTNTYSYEWTRLSDNSNVGNSATIQLISADSYEVLVTDGNGCTLTEIANVGAPTAVTLSATTNDPLCSQSSDGIAMLSAAGGTPGYTYQWSDAGAMTDTRNDLSAGNYTVTVTDAQGCIAVTDFLLNDPSPVEAIINTTPASCNGGADGQASITVSGGTGVYTFMWTGGQNMPGINGLSAGPIGVTVTDENGCQTTAQGMVDQPTALSLSTSFNNPKCFAAADGDATVTVSGGTGPYQYVWSNGQQTPTATGLNAGTFTVNITDANGCTASSSATLTTPTQLTATTTNGIVSCNGSNDGTVSVSPSGGTGPYTYTWSDPNTQHSQTATGLTLGSYTVTVTDAQGCTTTALADVAGVSAIELTLTLTAVRCFGGADGAISVTATGGAGTYNYSWSTPGLGNTANPSGLTSGTYAVTVTDNNNCFAEAFTQVTQPEALVLQTAVTAARCAGERSGAIDLNVQGGTSPYSYLWTNNTVTEDLSNVESGDYRVSVTDANGCIANISAYIPEPTVIRVDFAITPVDCFGDATGAASAMVTGGISPYQLNWSNNQTGTGIGPVVAGDYSLRITDANGCETTAPATIPQPAEALTVLVKPQDVTCFGDKDGLLQILTTGGTPSYSYSLDGSTYGGASTLIGLQPGTYTVFIRDAKGCTYVSSGNVVGEPEPITLNLGPDPRIAYGEAVTLQPQVGGGVGVLSYAWSPRDTSLLNCFDCATPVVTTDYQISFQLEVTDENGCSTDDIITVYVLKDNRAFVPSGFTPNSDNLNDRLIVHGKNIESVIRFRVFDRWGELVYEGQNFTAVDTAAGWDGKFREQPMNSGEYIWHLEVQYIDGTRETLRGSTLLIR